METTGFGILKAKQQEALEEFVSGKDTLGHLQFGCATSRLHVVTGGVLCWSLPPLLQTASQSSPTPNWVGRYTGFYW